MTEARTQESKKNVTDFGLAVRTNLFNWFGCPREHLADLLLLADVILLQHSLMKPVGMTYPRYGVGNLVIEDYISRWSG